MKISILRVKSVHTKKFAAAACVWLWAWPVAAGEAELLVLTRDLPGKFEIERSEIEKPSFLPGAAAARTTIFRTDKLDSNRNHAGLQYIDARYEHQSAANTDFDKIVRTVEDGESLSDEWKIVLQAQNEMHWLQAVCTMFESSPAESFRQAYANLVVHAEAKGVRANRALLCGCETPCMTVAIDR